ncbi:MAG: hypothetical protein RMM30_05630 [Armatimonadota bacterium]|nr:hypothetical protein [Armatimonadota bacterium]MDW8156050.1 hypothetical protein [Armatimonadota bacterium]
MGITSVEVEVAHVAAPDLAERVRSPLDSGAVCSVVPSPVLALRLVFDPLRRELKELPLLLGMEAFRPAS